VPTASAIGREYPLERPFAPEEGGLVSAPVPEPARAALAAHPAAPALAVAVEDGRLLPSLDRTLGYARAGDGGFELRGDRVAFASPGGGDPATNGRSYALMVPDPRFAALAEDALRRMVAGDDAAVADVIIRSCGINNTLLNNFFSQMDPVLDLIRRSGHDVGARAAVVGCGEVPWAPARLLAEGAEEVIANDLLPVRDTWDAAALEQIVEAVRRVAPGPAARLAARRRDLPGGAGFEGLRAVGGTPFEDIPLDEGSLDLIFSTSVLEHVMRPEEVYAAMARAVRPGGIAYHSVDLRDHRDFTRPLAFLALTDEEYASTATENRLRASDHVRLLTESGFRIVEQTIQALVAGGGPAGDGTAWLSAIEDVDPAVTEEDRAAMAPRFHAYDTRDLAVICIQFLAVREDRPA
jgi:SAM-dependent methyltransferase